MFKEALGTLGYWMDKIILLGLKHRLISIIIILIIAYYINRFWVKKC